MGERIYIFDTTLRDGEQSPGASMNIDEKIRMALQLEKLGVDIIEAGFPVASEGELESVKEVSKVITRATVAGLSRTPKADIDRAWQGVQYAAKPRIHTFIATSDIHLEYKLRKTRDQALKEAVEAVQHALSYTPDVEFSAEDATRSDWDYLCAVVEAVIEAGAKVVNIPDTVGYTIPAEYGRLLDTLRKNVSNLDRVILSAHCHDDLGLAVANSLTAIQHGVRQVECTINGIGERAGNASLEEIVMAIKVRDDQLPFYTHINTEELYRSSRLLSSLTGLQVPANKAIVGKNAFAHEAGIHQHGVIAKALTYEIMTPESVGRPASSLVMGKHSGRHGLRKRYQELGYQLSDDQLNEVYGRFTALADKKKEVFDEDLLAILSEESRSVEEAVKLDYFQTVSGDHTVPTATVKLRVGERTVLDSATGDGPIDALFNTISRITDTQGKLLDYSVQSVTQGKDAIGEVFVKVNFDGLTVIGRASSTDIIEASAKAYINALNKYYAHRDAHKPIPA